MPRTTDKRGSAKKRARLTTYLLTDPKFHRRPGTEGQYVNCAHCGQELNKSTLTKDRITPGGPYTEDNLQPACVDCNTRRGHDTSWAYN